MQNLEQQTSQTEQEEGLKVPRALSKLVDVEKLRGNTEQGEVLFDSSPMAKGMEELSNRIEGHQQTLAEGADKELPEVKEVRQDVRQERAEKQKEINEANAILKKMETNLKVAQKSKVLFDALKVLNDNLAEADEEMTSSVNQVTDFLDNKVGTDMQTKNQALDQLKRELKKLSVSEAVKKLKGESKALDELKLKLKFVEGFSKLIDKCKDELVVYDAGLAVEVGELKAMADGTIEEIVEELNKVEKVLELRDQVEKKAARSLDKNENKFTEKLADEMEGEEYETHKFEDGVVRQQENRDKTVEVMKEGLDKKVRDEIEAEGVPEEAEEWVNKELSKITQNIDEDFLTDNELQAYEDATRAEDLKGKIRHAHRRALFNAINRNSVETALGCDIIIPVGDEDFEQYEEGWRRLVFEKREQPSGTDSVLYKEMLEAKAVELKLREMLVSVDEPDEARAVVKALEKNDKLLQSHLKAVDAQINSLRVAGSVRSGKFKTKFAEKAADVAEGVVAAGAVYVATKLGIKAFEVLDIAGVQNIAQQAAETQAELGETVTKLLDGHESVEVLKEVMETLSSKAELLQGINVDQVASELEPNLLDLLKEAVGDKIGDAQTTAASLAENLSEIEKLQPELDKLQSIIDGKTGNIDQIKEHFDSVRRLATRVVLPVATLAGISWRLYKDQTAEAFKRGLKRLRPSKSITEAEE